MWNRDGPFRAPATAAAMITQINPATSAKTVLVHGYDPEGR